MGATYDAARCGVVELAHVPDTFASGMTEVEEYGNFLRVTLYVDRRRDPDGFDKTVERIVVAHIVWTHEDFQKALRIAMRAMRDWHPVDQETLRLS